MASCYCCCKWASYTPIAIVIQHLSFARYLNVNLELGIAQELVNSVHATDISGVVDESDSESESTENEVEMYFVDQFNCIIIVIMQLFVFYLLILVLFKISWNLMHPYDTYHVIPLYTYNALQESKVFKMKLFNEKSLTDVIGKVTRVNPPP